MRLIVNKHLHFTVYRRQTLEATVDIPDELYAVIESGDHPDYDDIQDYLDMNDDDIDYEWYADDDTYGDLEDCEWQYQEDEAVVE
jgi:hypothetical protein